MREREWLPHIKPPAGPHLPVDAVDHRKSAVREIQIHLSNEIQVIGFLRKSAATMLHNLQTTAGGDSIARQRSPVLRHVGLGRIDAFRTLYHGHAQSIVATIGPDFLLRPRALSGRE